MESIRFGICASPAQIAQAARAGYDYIELDLNRVLALNESEYREMTAQMERFGIYAEAVHAPLPEGMAIVGDGVSAQAIHDHLNQSFQLARMLGAEIIIFDCESSRRIPLNFDPAMAWRQLGNFIRILQAHAADNDLKVALLPLRRSSAELMNYITEATLISAMLRLDRVGVAASLYNMAEAHRQPALAHARFQCAGQPRAQIRRWRGLRRALSCPSGNGLQGPRHHGRFLRRFRRRCHGRAGMPEECMARRGKRLRGAAPEAFPHSKQPPEIRRLRMFYFLFEFACYRGWSL